MRRVVHPVWPLPVRLANMVAVGLVVPVAFFLLDMRLFAEMDNQSQGGLSTLRLFSVFVVQVGLLGVLAARWIELPALRWAIYAWCWLLIDIQTLGAASVNSTRYGDPSFILVKALFAAQAGLILMWGILGTTRWQLRLPAMAALVPLLAAPLFMRHAYAAELAPLFVAQLIALALICGLLRWRRFQLVEPQWSADDNEPAPVAEPTTSASHTPARRRDLKQAQFGIRHVLVWTTSLAFALGLLRLLGLLSIPGITQLVNSGLLGFATAGTLIAIVLIVALWAGLGEGAFYLRWTGLAISCLVAGAALIYIDHQQTPAWRMRSAMSRSWSGIFNDHWYWLAWTCLAGGLLLATLLMFRTLGYRLVRLPKRFPEGSSGYVARFVSWAMLAKG